MGKLEIIKDFSSLRPEAIGVFGYGSGVFKQARNVKSRTLTDIIFVVDDIQSWHMINMNENPNDYSVIGKLHLSRENVSKIKGRNNITYLSNIRYGDFCFKYGVIEIQDFLSSLSTWDNLFVAGRFQKPVLDVQSEEYIEEVIQYNRKCALIVACIFSKKVTTRENIYNMLCSLSYLGDARMKFAENPNKVKNIVNGSLELFEELYPLNQDFLIRLNRDRFIIRYDILLEKVGELPRALLDYLESIGTDFHDLDMVRVNIYSYLLLRNKIESSSQIVEGIKTNGIVRSVPYVLSKVKKRVLKF